LHFLDFSRNRLAAQGLPPGGTCVYVSFWVLFMNRRGAEGDPPGGVRWIASFTVIFDGFVA